ncbi:succinyl-diaminopimelate desuccinylase [Buchnera aphidicola]|uniref:Succinyl-diaminopimelate desuccinylase n=1 Tax=Buchnera aphidicola (Cinara cf. splendens/pseudotsugae 3390) TaxID=2518980 RepID=A0A451CX00_9GAMM|nr:succinyl-diaminopimelate desuccinylase [Buchnera aphidicola]VFP77635.1 Succinyl-diaminopimelate desuccinylase [Buchnera aphidicola (Cinara cf. splendens/pseudotsugae 3390)]
MYTKVLNLAQQLINIPSISPKDLGCQEILIQRLQSYGFFIEKMNFNDTNNFWAWRGSGKSITFLGHTDVVPAGNLLNWTTPPFISTVKNGVLFGRGAVDMKGSIAAMLIAVENFLNKNPNHHGRISFLITSDEESTGKNGIKKVSAILKKRNERINYCLVGEPTSEKVLGDCIKNGRRGSLSAELKIYGKQGHVAYPNLAHNPIHCSALFLVELSNLSFDKGNDFFEPTKIQISKIFSGKNYTTNMIPGELNVFFNIRFNPLVDEKVIINIINKLLIKHSLQHSISWKYYAKPFLSVPNNLCHILMTSIYNNTRITPVIKTNGGTSDGRFLFNLSDEIVEFGLLSSTIHQTNECVNVLDLLQLQNIYYDVLNALFL